MRVALCFSGHLSSIEDSFPHWKKIIDKYQCDVYGSFWNCEVESPAGDTLEKFAELFNPVMVESEDLESFNATSLNTIMSTMSFPGYVNPRYYPQENLRLYPDNQTYNSYSEGRTICMYYRIWRCHFLMHLHKGNKEYDIVVRCRTDCVPTSDFDFLPNYGINFPLHRTYYRLFDFYGPTDVFFYGNSNVMSYVCSLFLRITEYSRLGMPLSGGENLFSFHLSMKKIKTISHLIQMDLIRKDHRYTYIKILDDAHMTFINEFEEVDGTYLMSSLELPSYHNRKKEMSFYVDNIDLQNKKEGIVTTRDDLKELDRKIRLANNFIEYSLIEGEKILKVTTGDLSLIGDPDFNELEFQVVSSIDNRNRIWSTSIGSFCWVVYDISSRVDLLLKNKSGVLIWKYAK